MKSKCSARQEFVVAGFVPSTVSRKAIGSLALGAYEGDALQPVGRVGTDFTGAVAEDLFHRLAGLRVTASPFARRLSTEEAQGISYVRPELVVEVEFGALTDDGHLHHASFRGLREDKDAHEIVRESAASGSRAAEPATPQHKLLLTRPDRPYWSADGVTKQGLADYYAEVWDFIAPPMWWAVRSPFCAARTVSMAPSSSRNTRGAAMIQRSIW